jgi:hypothetical protein
MIINFLHLKTGLLRIMKLTSVIHTKIHTYVKFEVSIFIETKVTKSIIVKYTNRPTDRKLDILDPYLCTVL